MIILANNNYKAIYGTFQQQREELAARRAEAQTEKAKALAEKERVREYIEKYRKKEPVPRTKQFIRGQRRAWVQERRARLVRERHEAAKRAEIKRLETEVLPEVKSYITEVEKYEHGIKEVEPKIAEQEAKILEYQKKGYQVRETPEGKLEFYKMVPVTPKAPTTPKLSGKTISGSYGEQIPVEYAKADIYYFTKTGAPKSVVVPWGERESRIASIKASGGRLSNVKAISARRAEFKAVTPTYEAAVFAETLPPEVFVKIPEFEKYVVKSEPLRGIKAAEQQKIVWEVITGKRLVTGELIETPKQFETYLRGIPVEQWTPKWKEEYLQPKVIEWKAEGIDYKRIRNIFAEATISRVELPKQYQYKIEQAPLVYTPKGIEYGKKVTEYKYLPKAEVDPLYWSKQEMAKIQKAYKIPIVGSIVGTVAEYGFGAVSTFAALGRPAAEYIIRKTGIEPKPVHYVSPIDVALEPIGLAPPGSTEFIKQHPIFGIGGVAGEALQITAITKGIGYAGKGIKIGVGKAWGGALRYTGIKPIEVFWAKSKMLRSIQRFAIGKGLYDPTKGKFTTRIFLGKSKIVGVAQKFAYERGLLDPLKSSRLFRAKSKMLRSIQRFARERGLISIVPKYPVSAIKWKFAKATGRGLFKAGEVTVPYPTYQAARVRGVWGTYPTRETKELWTATYEPYQEMQTLIYPKEGLIPERVVYWKKPRGYVGYDAGDVARQIESITGKAPSLLELETMQYSVMGVGRGIEAMPSAGYYAKFGQIQTKVRFERHMGFYGLPEVPMVSVTKPTVKGIDIAYKPSKRIQELIRPEVELRPMKYYGMPDIPVYKAIPEYKLVPKVVKYATMEELGLPTGFQPIGKVTTGVKEWLKTRYYQRFLPPSQTTLGYPFEIGKIAGIEKITGRQIATRAYIEEARIEALGLKVPMERIPTTTGWREYLARKDWFVVTTKPKQWGVTPWQFIKTKEVVKTSEDIGKSVLKLITKPKEVSKVSTIRFPVKHFGFNIHDLIAIEKLEEGIPIGISRYWAGAIPAPPSLKRITTGALAPALAIDVGKITGGIRVQALGEKVKPRYELELVALTKPSFDVFRETIQPSISATLQAQGMTQAQMQAQMQTQLQAQMQKLKMPPILITKLDFPPRSPPETVYRPPSHPTYEPPYEPPATYRPPIIPPLLFPTGSIRKKKRKKKYYRKKYRFRRIIVPDPLKGMEELKIEPSKIKEPKVVGNYYGKKKKKRKKTK